LPGRIWAARQPLWIPEIVADPSFARASSAAQEGLRSAFGFPVFLAEEFYGVVEFFSRVMHPPDPDLLRLMAATGSQIGQFIERKQAEAQRERVETEIRQLNQHLERRVEERTAALKETTEQMESFSYSVSHDLRAPLRALQGFAEALMEDYSGQLDPIGQEYVRRISGAARHMDTLIQDILAYSRISRAEIEFRVVNLQNVVDEVLSAMASEMQARGARVEVERPLPAVTGHASTLKQVVTNLLSNAIKFVEGVTLPCVRIYSTRTEEGMTRLWVEDNGIGIAPEHQERIFRVFERLHGIETYPGTGIGLAIVRKGIERMGGRAGVESSLRQGSRFWIELPSAGGPPLL
jgi:signal transduction histidine kinase